jgi:23S rRNA pseudouridine1911/1915/1917 synthase
VFRYQVSEAEGGERLDHFVSRRLLEHSRARIQQWIEPGRIRVEGVPRKASHKLRAGAVVEVEPAAPEPLRAFAEDIPLRILYEDDGVAAVNKPAGMVVHAGAGQRSGTLVNALLHRYGALSNEGGALRPGIVHRLDKGTSGVMLVAKNDAAHRALSRQFAARKVKKTYVALVQGRMMKSRAKIEAPIGRDPLKRTRMSARVASGRSAHTEYEVIEEIGKYSLLRVHIGTGRTHQIRVHLASLRHPVAGDTLYGAAACALGRPFLHSLRIRFTSPATGEPVEVESPLAQELVHWLDELRSASLKEGDS